MARNNVKTINVDNSYLKSDDINDYGVTDLPSIDIRHGGQWGRLPRIGGLDNDENIHEWMHEQRYQKRDVIPIVLNAPRGFDLFPNGGTFKQGVKAMLEVHAKTITGIDSSLTMEVKEHDLGINGGKFREVTGSTRASTDITITVEEKEGNPFEILLDVWCRYLLDDPDLHAPLITRLLDIGEIPAVWSDDYKSMTALFIEPDVLLRKPVHAWLVCNLFPDTNPDITGSKDKMAANEFKDMKKKQKKTITIVLSDYCYIIITNLQ